MNLIEQIKINNTSIDGYQGTYYAEGGEYVKLTTDSEGKILEGIKSDGSKYIPGNLIVDGSIYNGSFNIEQIVEDIQERVDEALEPVEDTMSYFETIDNSEWLQVTTDSSGRILGGRKIDGTLVENVGLEINQPDEDIIKLLAYKKWHGKKIVCFGDSITEYAEYVRALEEFFDTPIYNRGNSGRSVSLGGQSNSFCERVTYPANNDLVSHSGGLPSEADLVLLEGGTNDWTLLKEQELGDITAPITTNISAPRENNTLYTFAGAYMFVLAKLKEKYPNAEIYTLNLHGIQSTNSSNYRWKEVYFTDPTDEYSGFVYNNNINTPGQTYTIEKTLEDYRKIIREASSFYGVKCIELKNSKINFLCKENRERLSKDGLHPNDEGGYEMAKYIINNLELY